MKEQGDLVRQLKADKASKEVRIELTSDNIYQQLNFKVITEAVNVLKALKVEAETEAAAGPVEATNGDAVEEDEV